MSETTFAPPGNPTPEAVQQLILELRQGKAEEDAKRRLLEEERAAKSKKATEFKKQEAEQSLLVSIAPKDNPDGYPGFDKARDELALQILSTAMPGTGLNDILVMPGAAGMSAKGSNSAVTLMTGDQVQQFRMIAMDVYGPDYFPVGFAPTPEAKHPVCYLKLLDRIRIGTILISGEQFDDEVVLKGTIWHESGHKSLEHKAETGAVFVRELELVAKHMPGELMRWITEVRKYAYFRANGLKFDPGRGELLDLLQRLCTAEEFYREFREEYQDIKQAPLKPPPGMQVEPEAQGPSEAVERNGLWLVTEGKKSRFGLSQDGPFIYANSTAATNDLALVKKIRDLITQRFPGCDAKLVDELILKHVLKTAKVD